MSGGSDVVCAVVGAPVESVVQLLITSAPQLLRCFMCAKAAPAIQYPFPLAPSHATPAASLIHLHVRDGIVDSVR